MRYVALLTSLAPEISGEQNPTEYPVPRRPGPGPARQLDLSPVLSGTGITVYANNDWLPQRAEVPAGTPVPDSPRPDPLAGRPGSGVVPGAVPVLAGPAAARSYAGPLTAGHRPRRRGPGRSLEPGGPHGSAGPPGLLVRLGGPLPGDGGRRGDPPLRGGLVAPLSLVASVVVWLAALALLMGRSLGRPWARVRKRRRVRAEAGGDADRPDGAGIAVDAAVGEPVP